MTKANEEITIKLAKEDDVALILTFIKELAEYEKLLDQVVTTKSILKETLFMREKVARVIIGYYNNNPAGFALYFYNFSTFLGVPGIYIEDIYVREDFRGKGIGQKMLRFIAQIAQKEDCGRVEWSVLDWNQSAINFYLKLGAMPKDEWTTYTLNKEAINNLAGKNLL